MATGCSLVRILSPFRASGRLYSRFIQIAATTNPHKEVLEKRTKSRLIQLYVKYFVQFCYQSCSIYFDIFLSRFFLCTRLIIFMM